jgi:uncharacterized membrane protein
MNLKLFIIFSVVLLTLDIFWLSYFGKTFGKMIQNIQGSPMQLNYIGAIFAYIIMILAYTTLAYDNDKPNYLKGAILGLAIYGVYDFTNYATIKGWDPKIFSIDIAWGVFLSVASLFITDLIYKNI